MHMGIRHILCALVWIFVVLGYLLHRQQSLIRRFLLKDSWVGIRGIAVVYFLKKPLYMVHCCGWIVNGYSVVLSKCL